MNISIVDWSEEKYQEYCDFLRSIGDNNYKMFQQRLISTKYEIIGIRVPKMKEIAKEIIRGDWRGFLKYCKGDLYEEVFIEAMVRGLAKSSIEEKERLILDFIEKIDNWAINDSFLSTLKMMKKDNKRCFEFAKSLLPSNVWSIRLGLLMMMDYCICPEYIDEIMTICSKIDNSYYYVSMANAWLLATCYINYPEKVVEVIRMAGFDQQTKKRTIQKICDSYRVSEENKKLAKSYR